MHKKRKKITVLLIMSLLSFSLIPSNIVHTDNPNVGPYISHKHNGGQHK